MSELTATRLRWTDNLDTIDLRALALAGIALSIAFRLAFGMDAPLWLDETFTGAIAAAPDFAAWLSWSLSELSGPAYYFPLWVWEKLAGESNVALRLPSLAASIAAPIFVWRYGHRDRDVRMVWAALLALWFPGLEYATEARPYAWLLLLGAAQASAFFHMATLPGARAALPWAIVTALAILTKYYALPIAGLQALGYLVLQRGAAWRAWPAALVFVPVAAWSAVHLPFVLRIMSPTHAWFASWSVGELLGAFTSIVGAGFLGGPLLALIGWRLRAMTRAEQALALSALGAMAFVFALALLRPSFTPRYLIPYVPALLATLAIVLVRLDWRRDFAIRAVLAVFASAVLITGVLRLGEPRFDRRYGFNFEEPTAWLRARPVDRLIFLWDNPTASAGDPARLAEVGSYFFRRSGQSVPTIVPALPATADPNIALAALATRPGDAILWAYDVNVPATRGARFPAKLQHAFDCRDFGRGGIIVLACRQR